MFERDLRAMAVVQRWGIVTTIRSQNLAEHSYFVTVYANDICVMLGVTDDIRLNVLKACLGHDLDEVLTGDIPGPHKRHIMVKNSHWLYEAMGKVFPSFEERFGFDKRHGDSIKAIVKTADLLESVLYLIEEKRMGNANVDEHLQVLTADTLKQAEKLIFIESKNHKKLMEILTFATMGARYVPFNNSRITYDEELS